MSLELAERLGIEPSAALDVQGLQRYVTGVAQGPALAVGIVHLPPARYAVLVDMHRYGYDLVLGADFFAHLKATIDYGRREVELAPPDPSADDGIPVTFQNFIPVLPVKLGEADAVLALDTGDESSINLGYPYYQAHPDLFAVTGKAEVGGVGGTSEELTGHLSTVRIGNFVVARPAIGATKNLLPTAQGHVGSGFLMHFTVELDYGRAQVALTPRPGDRDVTALPAAP